MLKEDAKVPNSLVFDNPFGIGKMYKTGKLGRWTFSGRLEFLGKVPAKVKPKTKVEDFSDDLLKNYDYTKVNCVLERNTRENFKTISKTDVRKYFVSSEGLDTLELILHMNS